MVELLALIGLGWLVYKASKGLKVFGNRLEAFSSNMSDYIVEKTEHTKHFDPQDHKKIANKIEGIKGSESDETFKKKVREEIDRITSQ